MTEKRKWYGRPNNPPLNWHDPDNPVIRHATSDEDDIPLRVTAPPEDRSLIAVSLKNRPWLAILDAIYEYDPHDADSTLQHWQMNIRKAILGAVNPNTDYSRPVAVKLSLEDWRKLWKCVNAVCQERGGRWPAWFKLLSEVLSNQIKEHFR